MVSGLSKMPNKYQLSLDCRQLSIVQDLVFGEKRGSLNEVTLKCETIFLCAVLRHHLKTHNAKLYMKGLSLKVNLKNWHLLQ